MKEKQILKNFNLKQHKNTLFFDNASQTLKPKSVVKAVSDYYINTPSNYDRGIYKIAHSINEKINQTRENVAKFINASANEIVFTQNTTDSLNLVAQSFGKLVLKKGDEVLISKLEHHSNYLSWIEVCEAVGAKVNFIPLTKDGKITLANFKKVLTPKTKIVSLSFVSNVTGSIAPIKQISQLCKKNATYIVVDAAQAVAHFPIDVAELNVDFLAFSGYKMFAPNGVGVLYGKYQHLNKMKPLKVGGGMVNNIHELLHHTKDAPYKFEAGTLAIENILGLNEAIKFINKISYDYITKKDELLKNYLFTKLQDIPEVKIYNPNADVAIVTFNIANYHAHDMATLYDELNINVRAGNHCAQPIHDHFGQVATIRVSLAFYNTINEIDKFILATKKIIEFYKKQVK